MGETRRCFTFGSGSVRADFGGTLLVAEKDGGRTQAGTAREGVGIERLFSQPIVSLIKFFLNHRRQSCSHLLTVLREVLTELDHKAPVWMD